MPWSGGVYTRTNGTYNGATVWASDAAASVKIQSSRHDTHDQDIANGINACLLKDFSNLGASSFVNITISGITFNLSGGSSPLIFAFSNGQINVNSYSEINASSYGFSLFDSGTITTSVMLDFRKSSIQRFTETSAQNPTITFHNPSNQTIVYVEIIAPASGTSPTISWPATVKGSPPTTVALGKINVLTFLYDGSRYVYLGASGDVTP